MPALPRRTKYALALAMSPGHSPEAVFNCGHLSLPRRGELDLTEISGLFTCD